MAAGDVAGLVLRQPFRQCRGRLTEPRCFVDIGRVGEEWEAQPVEEFGPVSGLRGENQGGCRHFLL